MSADHCPGCPFAGCETCRYQGGHIPNAPVDKGVSSAPCERMGMAKTSDPLRQQEAALAAPIRTTEGSDLPTW